MTRRTLTLSALLPIFVFACCACGGPMRTAPNTAPAIAGTSTSAKTGPTTSAQWSALLKSNGELSVNRAGKPIATLMPELFDDKWQRRTANALGDLAAPRTEAHSAITAPDGTRVAALVRYKSTERAVALSYALTPDKAASLNSLDVGSKCRSRRSPAGATPSTDSAGTSRPRSTAKCT